MIKKRELSMTFEGQLRGDKIFGYFTPPQGNRIFATGTWVTPTLSIIGEWEITMISGESEISSTLLFYQKSDGILAGKWISQKGESELSGVKFENGKLTFTQKRTVREKELISTFEGAVKNEILRGYMKMEVTGKKKK